MINKKRGWMNSKAAPTPATPKSEPTMLTSPVVICRGRLAAFT